MRIKDLPAELRDLALKRQFEERGLVNETSLVIASFDWDKTKEGDRFWHNVEKGNFKKAEKLKNKIEDSIVNAVVKKFKQRSKVGIEKYGTTLDRDDLSFEQWIEHAIEEAMDLTLYLQKIKQELKTKTTKI